MSNLNLHSLTIAEGSKPTRTRVGRGRGSGVGKTSGRGHKGQMSRSGAKRKAAFEGGQMRLLRRMPKRGFNNNRFRTVYIPVSVGALGCFAEGTEVTPDSLAQAGLANSGKIKILGCGELEVKLTVSAHAFSATAKKKIEAAGGECKVIN